ncbi:hypothetical protein MTO96_004589 [Rhipicephalus appendiculatus]
MPRLVPSTPGLFPLLFAISAPLALAPLLYESGPFRLVYALCCSALLYTSHAVPVQTVALPSLALLPPLASPEASRDACLSAMRLVATALLCGTVTESSSLVARVALRLLSVAGTRLLRFPPMEEIQRRCLLRKVTRGLTSTERRTLARFIFREQCALPPRPGAKTPDADMQDTDVSSGLLRGYNLQPNAPQANAPKPNAPQSASRTKQDTFTRCQPFSLSPPPQVPRRPSRIKLLLPPNQATDDDAAPQRIVAPGESSPEWIKRTLRDEHAEFLEPIVFGDPVLLDICLWHSSRYTKLEAYLLYSTLLVHTLVSMTAFTASPENRLMIDYDRRLPLARRLSSAQWQCVVIPAVVFSCTVLGYYVARVLLETYDVDEDFKSSRIFNCAVAEAGKRVAAEGCGLQCTGGEDETSLANTSEEKLVSDYGVLVPLLAWMSVFTKPRTLGSRVTPALERVVRTLPWGALLLVVCQLAAHAAWPAFAPAAFTASVRLAHSLGGQSPVVIQVALTSVSCLLTEFLGARSTVTLLLPAAAILAQQRKCPWPYLAVPLTAASSVGVILPTASVTMAVLHDLADLKPDVTVLPGILTKMAATLALVLGANTVGIVMLGWTTHGEVVHHGLNASDLFTAADEHGA